MISKIFWVLAFSYTIAKVLLHDCQVMSILASFFFFSEFVLLQIAFLHFIPPHPPYTILPSPNKAIPN